MSKKETIKKYKDDFVIIQSLFNLLDPCGLIQSGSPIDEYDCLTTQILSGLYQNKSNQDMEDLILTELDHNFGTISKSEISIGFRKDLNKFINEIKLKIKPSC